MTNPCPCQRKCFIFMLCIHINNKDLFYHPIWSSGPSAGKWFALCCRAVLEDLDIPNILFGHATIYPCKICFRQHFQFWWIWTSPIVFGHAINVKSASDIFRNQHICQDSTNRENIASFTLFSHSFKQKQKTNKNQVAQYHMASAM